MANTPQARKRARQNEVRRARNTGQRAGVRTSIKKFLKLVEGKDLEAAQAAYREATSRIDQAVHKGLHHRNTAARLKHRLNVRLRAIAVGG